MADDDSLMHDLFAYRIYFMDINEDEHFIIKKLKEKLIELNYRDEELNSIIYSFYNYFDIPITLSEIENIQINNYSNIIFIDINLPNDNYDDMPPLIDATEHHYESVLNMPYIPNLLNILLGVNNIPFNQVLVEPNNIFNDIVITTDENSLNNLIILKISHEQNEKCTICLEDMVENDEYFNIECKHIFHKNCLETYLKNYNHICPVCRKEIGTARPII